MKDDPIRLEGERRRGEIQAVLDLMDRTPDPVSEEAMRVHRTLKGPTAQSWPEAFDLSLLNPKAVMTIREAVESWRRWCDRWDEALATVPQIRRVK